MPPYVDHFGLKVEHFPAMLSATPTRKVPTRLDNMGDCLPASNQGKTSECAWFSLTCGVEALRWRQDDIFEQLETLKGYPIAKSLDGSPNTEGTTLHASVLAAQQLGLLKPEVTAVTLTTAEQVKYCVHRYGGCQAGFNITDDWFRARSDGVIPNNGAGGIGGHAVWICGYDEEYVYICNSWGEGWGWFGFGKLTWLQFHQQFLYAVEWKGAPR